MDRKRFSVVLLFAFLLLFLSTSVHAKNDKDNPSDEKKSEAMEKSDKSGKEDKDDDSEDSEDDSGDNEDSISSSQKAHDRNTIRRIEKIADGQEDDDEVDQEVEEIVTDQSEVEDSVDTAVEEIDNRGDLIKFLVGPDYKNLGQLRKDVVQTRNNIRKLEKLKEKSSEDLQDEIDLAIASLETKSNEIETMIYERSTGFSLFGWLSRLLVGYTPEEPGAGDITPEPSITPSETITPVATGSATPTEIVTPTP